MPGGMKFDHDAIRELPLPYQEQIAMKFARELVEPDQMAQRLAEGIAKTAYVAELAMDRKARSTKVRRLCFPSDRAAERYRMLRDAVREGVISDLRCETCNGQVCAFVYRLQWAGEFLPHTLPVRDLLTWAELARERGKGAQVIEQIKEGS